MLGGKQHTRVRRALALLGATLGACAIGLSTLSVDARPAEAVAVNLYDALNDGAWRSAQGANALAQSFTTGADPVKVTSVAAWLRNATEGDSSAVNTTYTIAIWTSSGGAPDAFLRTIAGNVSISAWGDGSTPHSPGSTLSLAPNTTYFVVVTGGAGGTLGWKCNTTAITTDITPTPTFSTYATSNSGSSWSALTGTCAGSHFSMKVDGVTQTATTLSGFGNVNAFVGDPAVTLTAPTASNAGTFTYTSSNTAVATVAGDQLSVVATGTSTITADFTPSDDTTYAPASISMTVTVSNPPPPPPPPPTTTAPPTTAPPGPAPTTTTTTPPATTSTAAPTTAAAPTTTVGPSTPTTTSSPTTVPAAPSTTVPETTLPGAPSDNPFDNSDREPVSVVIDASVGAVADGTSVLVSSSSLEPNADVTVTVYSEPQVLLRDRADANGRFRAVVQLPPGLEPGRHTLVAETTTSSGPVSVAGAFLLDDGARFAKIVQPSALVDFAGPEDDRLTRALEYGRDPYDPRTRPLTTASIVVAATSLLSIMGAVGMGAGMGTGPSGSSTGPGGSGAGQGGQEKNNKSKSKGKLAQVVTKKLKGLSVESTARGDQSITWMIPATAAADAFSRSAPGPLGKWSAMAPRIFVDGAWLRAMFGSLGFVTWVAGAVLGACAAFVDTPSPVTPAFGFIVAISVLGTLDAGGGAVAWLVIVLLGLVTGNVSGWADVRTLLGLGLVLFSLALLAHVIRPLRRYVAANSFERWERVLDYVIMPVFVAYAAGAMLKALNGLSGLKLVDADQIVGMRWAAFVAVIIRLGMEDVTAHLYPQRMKMVQPAKFTSQNRIVKSCSIALRTAVFLMVAQPFFGINAITITAAVLLAVPHVLKMWEDDLPNSATLNKWLPRGHLQFFCLLVLGAFLSVYVVGADASPEHLKSTLIWMLLPGVVAGVVELFGRSGGTWPSVALKRSLGAVTWTIAAGMTVGVIVLFR